MISRRLAFSIVSILLLSINASIAFAQPSLPGITGSAANGVVTLSWNCQYDGVRAISVTRSADSANNYKSIGYVKRTEKGIQQFTDYHPLPGENFYKLSIVFATGLGWNSNHYGVYIEQPVAIPAKPTVPTAISLPKQTPGKDSVKQPVKKNSQKPARPKLSVTFDPDTTHIDASAHRDAINPNLLRMKRINISADDPESGFSNIIVSQFIFTDPVSGHVDMFLPDDIKDHRYSVKFYNSQNEIIIEIPKISTQKTIIDKRNFQKAGVYKFTLRKDIVEFESGYITVAP